MTIATRLVECGADPDNRQHGCGGTPLHHTLAGGYIELVKFLLTSHADVNASNRYGVHPLHIAVKREYTDCIEYLMTWELPQQKVRDELAWAVQYDLSQSVLCLLELGAPHGLRVLAPWTALVPRAQSSWDFSLPLGYYLIMRGWHVSALVSVLAKGWSKLQQAVACAWDDAATATALADIRSADSAALAERSLPYKVRTMLLDQHDRHAQALSAAAMPSLPLSPLSPLSRLCSPSSRRAVPPLPVLTSYFPTCLLLAYLPPTFLLASSSCATLLCSPPACRRRLAGLSAAPGRLRRQRAAD